MDIHRHKTQKKIVSDLPATEETFKVLLEDSAREAYMRPWHRIERGLRLNRLRIYVEDMAPAHNMTKEEKESFFIYLQKALDKKLLNTLKIVQYNQESQRITAIKGLEVNRQSNGAMRWAFVTKKPRGTEVGTRKKKKDENAQSDNMSKIEETTV
jgi:hypothetical protein